MENLKHQLIALGTTKFTALFEDISLLMLLHVNFSLVYKIQQSVRESCIQEHPHLQYCDKLKVILLIGIIYI